MKLISIIPYMYFLETRLTGVFQKISWFFVYFIPGFFLLYCVFGSIDYVSSLYYVVGLLIINYVYENGYIQNDVKTVQKEKTPTMRLNSEFSSYLNQNWNKVIFVRCFILFSLFYIYYLIDEDLIKTLYLLVVALLLQMLFILYNSVRSRLNLFLILPLSYIRFYGFFLPFVPPYSLLEFLSVTVLLYPLSKFLEFSKLAKFNLNFMSELIGNIDTFRVKYYAAVVVITTTLVLFFDTSWLYVGVAAYYFLYRAMGLVLIRNKSTVRTEFETLSKSDYRK